MNRSVMLLAVVCLSVSSAAAQERRSGGPAGPVAPREIVAAVSAKPFIGSWMGNARVDGGGFPVSVDILPEGAGYKTLMYLPNGAMHPAARTELLKGILQFTSPNSGGGVWIYEATRVRGDTLFGTVRLADPPEGVSFNGEILLVRMKP